MSERALQIAIIDDDLQDRLEVKAALLRGSLRRYRFHEAAAGLDGLALLRRLGQDNALDCAILDLHLPEIDAFDILAELPRIDGLIAFPVVVITGDQRSETAQALLKAGAQDFVGKGWLGPDSLTRAVDHAMERHALMRALRERDERIVREAQRHREIVETMTEGVCVVGQDERIELTNGAMEKMLGYPPGALLGKPISAIIPEGQIADCRSHMLARTRGQASQGRLDIRLQGKDGREVWTSCAFVGLTERGEVRSILTIHTDITESRKLAEKLQQAQKLESLGVLAGGIAHDFNNLLVAILGNVGLALAELPPEAPARTELERVESAAVRAAELTRQMLAYAGRGRFVIARLDLGRLVEEMGHLLSAAIPKNVVLKYRLAPGLPAVEGDATQLRQVIMNLITNAADAIGTQSGVITISTAVMVAEQAYLKDTYLDDTLAPGQYITLEVSDTGSGMPPETKAKIFDPFFTTKFTGRGLGLAAVLGILRAHKGAIKVYSEVGRGSTFKVLLPAVSGGLDAVIPSVEAEVASSDGGTILVVDDEESIRNVSRRILERAGFQVLTANDGVEAMAIFQERHASIRAVLLDVTMPRMGGEETFRQMRLVKPDVKVVLSSGYSEHEATSQFTGKGLAAFLEKPFKPRELVECLKAVLAPRHG